MKARATESLSELCLLPMGSGNIHCNACRKTKPYYIIKESEQWLGGMDRAKLTNLQKPPHVRRSDIAM